VGASFRGWEVLMLFCGGAGGLAVVIFCVGVWGGGGSGVTAPWIGLGVGLAGPAQSRGGGGGKTGVCGGGGCGILSLCVGGVCGGCGETSV